MVGATDITDRYAVKNDGGKSMDIKIFNRYECKYIVNRDQRERLIRALDGHTCFDRHCPEGKIYSIHNIYLDTELDDVVRRSIDSPYYKEKLRIRTYKLPDSMDGRVFVELKKKIGSIVNKRRASLSLSEAYRFIESGVLPEGLVYLDRQVLSEISFFLANNKVYPKVYIAYDRLALYSNEDKSLRITFDDNLRSRRSLVGFEYGDLGRSFLDGEFSILEIKHSGVLPLWLASTLSELKIFKNSFSKYGTEYKLHIMEQNLNEKQIRPLSFVLRHTAP